MRVNDFAAAAELDAKAPGPYSVLVTPHDSNPIFAADNTGNSRVARRLFVQTGGTVCFVGADKTTVDTWTVPSNFYMEVGVYIVKSTGTSASGIHAIA